MASTALHKKSTACLFLVWTWGFLLATAGCAGLGRPDALDAARAGSLWPGADLSTLEAGRAAYVRRCSGCHGLYLPESVPSSEWPQRIDEMKEDAKVTLEEQKLIEQFLVTRALRAEEQKRNTATTASR